MVWVSGHKQIHVPNCIQWFILLQLTPYFYRDFFNCINIAFMSLAHFYLFYFIRAVIKVRIILIWWCFKYMALGGAFKFQSFKHQLYITTMIMLICVHFACVARLRHVNESKCVFLYLIIGTIAVGITLICWRCWNIFIFLYIKFKYVSFLLIFS